MTAGLHGKMAATLLAKEVAPTTPTKKGNRQRVDSDPPGSGSSAGTMDPGLKRRMEEQLAKEESGQYDVVEVGTVAKAESKMDPVLQRRIEQQLAKEMGAEPSIESNISSASKIERNFEPELRRRFEAQLAKEEGKAEPLPESLEFTGKIYTRLDPKLQKRMERQQEKETTGESDVKETGMKDHRIACQADLERRMAKQREKVITGVSEVGEVGSAVGRVDRVNPELAAKFERRRLLEAEAAARAAAGSDGGSLRERRGTCVHQLGSVLRRLLCLGRSQEAQ